MSDTQKILADVQGNILLGYRFTHARFVFLNFGDAAAGRKFVETLGPEVTCGDWGTTKPTGATNIAFTHRGLTALDLPRSSLASFPRSFAEGMPARAWSLGDADEGELPRWADLWLGGRVHCLASVFATGDKAVEARLAEFRSKLPQGIGVLDVQDAAVPEVDGKPVRIEHFGFRDGLSNPLIEGFGGNSATRIGNPDGEGGFRPVALGEFLLGYPDEGRELSPMPRPKEFARNGTFMVYRKLRQHVAKFKRFLEEQEKALKPIHPAADKQWIAEKLVGRRRDGTPLTLGRPGSDSSDNDFSYLYDPDGAECPLGAHIRRSNPRDALGFDGALAKRHRMIRRGMPYGRFVKDGETPDDEEDRGLIFIAFNASIDRQFEFVQRQWIEYGDNFHQGNDKDPIAGAGSGGKFVIPGQNIGGVRPPLICQGLEQFVEATGGEYFFVPSITALHLMARGLVSTV